MELAKALYNEGASVFGWDMEWNMNYNINRYRGTRVPRYNSRVTCPDTRYRYGGSAMFYRLNPKGGKLPGKMVVLTHDIAHRSVGSQHSSQESQYNLDLIYELQN